MGSLSHKGKSVPQQVFVVEGLNSNLLGLPAITALHLVVQVETTRIETIMTADIQQQFPSVFQGLGNLGSDFKIHLKQGAVLTCSFTPRQVPLPLQPKIKRVGLDGSNWSNFES